jgi:hypothetical protein
MWSASDAAPLLAFEAPPATIKPALAGQFGQDDRCSRRAHRGRWWRCQRDGVGSGFPHGKSRVSISKPFGREVERAIVVGVVLSSGAPKVCHWPG